MDTSFLNTSQRSSSEDKMDQSNSSNEGGLPTTKEKDESVLNIPSRTAYLPLVSPGVEEKPRKFETHLQEGGSSSSSDHHFTPNKRQRENSDGLGYFDITKKTDSISKSSESIDTSSLSTLPSEDSETSSKKATRVEEENKDDLMMAQSQQPSKRARIPLVTLPDMFGDPLMRAIEQSMSGSSASGSQVMMNNNNTFVDDDDASSTASFFTSSKVRTHRAMSVPRNLRSKVHPVTTLMIASSSRRPSNAPSSSSGSNNNDQQQTMMTERQRRNSVRSQQLSLLASQARLARTGTSNVNTALRTEQAMMKAMEDVQQQQIQQQRKQSESNTSTTAGLLTNGGGSSGRGSISPIDEGMEDERMEKVHQDPIHTWSEALADRDKATSFLESAKEVANHWANGFYAYEKEWIGSALQKEQRKLEAEGRNVAGMDNNETLLDDEQDENEEEIERRKNARRTSVSAPPASIATEKIPIGLSEKDIVIGVEVPSKITVDVGTVKQTLIDAQRRLSKSISPATANAIRTSVRESTKAAADAAIAANNANKVVEGVGLGTITTNNQFDQMEIVKSRNGSVVGGGGKLVDVLSNFATLIDSHKEGCHSLEKLAQNARRLSAVQLPSVIRYPGGDQSNNTLSPSSRTTNSVSNPTANTAAMTSMSAVSSEAGSPLSVMGSTVG